MKLKFNDRKFELTGFKNEEDLEKGVVSLAEDIFGKKSIYIDLKKKVKRKTVSFANIPDGYLLDFRSKIKLWIVENELSTHDSFKHIGVQLLRFATQFSEASFAVKEFLNEYINNNSEVKEKFNFLVRKSEFSNISEALDFAIYKNDYGFIVVIDEINEDLTKVTREIARQPELIEIKKFSFGPEEIFMFDEFLKDFEESISPIIDPIEIDTIVCPAREDGFKSAFLDEKAWWAVRISPNAISKLKYISMYEVAPVSAIRWAGKIQSIKPYEDTGKYKIYCSEIFKVGPIKLDLQKKVPQAPRYTKFDLVLKAKKLSDIF
jgi:hypothetical protein